MAILETAAAAVAHNNVKTIGEALAFLQTQACQDFVAHRNRLDRISEAYLGRVMLSYAETDPMEAVSALKLLSGNDTAQNLAALLAAIASGQQGIKGAQTTPPVTP